MKGRAGGAPTLGNTTSYGYDGNFNRLSANSAAPLSGDSQTFDARNNLTGASDALGNWTTFFYNSDNTLHEVRDPIGGRRVHSYKSGAIKGLVETIKDYPVDSSGGVSNKANVTRLTYDPKGQLATVTTPDGATVTYTYDQTTGWPTSIVTADSDGTVITELTLVPDTATGRPVHIAERKFGQSAANASERAIAYDSRGNVWTVTDALRAQDDI